MDFYVNFCDYTASAFVYLKRIKYKH